MTSFISAKSSLANKIFQITKIKNRKKWTDEDDALLVCLAKKYKEKHWKEISNHFNNKNSLQCFSRYKRVRPGIVKGAWTKEEDEQIVQLVREYGESWSRIAKIVTSRNGKQIRDRYINALDPNIKKGKFSDDEDRLLIKLYIANGPKWSMIAKSFPNRTADMVKNRFHSSIKKIFFSQETGTRKTKLMMRLKEKKLSAMNDYDNDYCNTNSQCNQLALTLINSDNCSNTISNNICFSLQNNKKKKDLNHQLIHNDNNNQLHNNIDNNNGRIEMKQSEIHSSSESTKNNNNHNCTSSFEDIDFFSLLKDDLFFNTNTNEFFNLN